MFNDTLPDPISERLPSHQRNALPKTRGASAKRGRARLQATGFGGKLTTCPVSDLLGMLSGTRKTGTLLLRDGMVSGWLRFREGQVAEARCSPLRGREAALTLVGLSRGLFDFQRTDPNPAAAREETTFTVEELLLEDARLKDDTSRKEDRLPPGDRGLRAISGSEDRFERHDGPTEALMRTILELVADRPGTTFDEILQRHLGSPRRVRHAVALLLEDGGLAVMAEPERLEELATAPDSLELAIDVEVNEYFDQLEWNAG